MAIVKKGEKEFRAYARLISVLGDQLISDKWVGVIELVKNSYDADAEEVFVRFKNFENPTKENPPTIEIEDDGHGMTIDTVLDVWMKPATPNKLNKKKVEDTRSTKKGRVMQGDKGVGRFAVYKLGNYVELYTKTTDSDEVKLTLDFEEYASDEFVESDHKDKFLDQIKNEWEVNDVPLQINNEKGQGTKLIIKATKDTWKERDLNKLKKAFFRMTPPKLPGMGEVKMDFDVLLYWEGKKQLISEKGFDEILGLAPFYYEGAVNKEGIIDFKYTHNKKIVEDKFDLFSYTKKLSEYQIWNLKFFRENFLELKEDDLALKPENLTVTHRPDFGEFIFFFYAFDWKNPTEGLKRNEKSFLKENSVFLFRDNVRVFPYGEKGNDWLLLSKYRAEDRAGYYFSYNDLLGFVFISQADNPKLRDSADREGLMNIEGSYDDFVAILQASLKIMKDNVDIDKAKKKLRQEKAYKSYTRKFEKAFESLKKKLLTYDDKELIDKSQSLFEATNGLVQKVREELKITQELAGTGMAVEKATHDTMSLLKRLRENVNGFVSRLSKKEITEKELKEFFLELEEGLEFIYQELQVLQPLFRVARKVTKDVSIEDVARRVAKYFKKDLNGEISVNFEVDEDVVVRTNTGLILQVLLNLMDNAIYWLKQSPTKDKEIKIKIDGKNHQIIFSDSGIGIDKDIQEVIFSEFYSKKEEGRGLGLYIVKELLDRIDAEIEIVQSEKRKILKGANFLIQFKEEK
jgi:signal transduction histidine kinase